MTAANPFGCEPDAFEGAVGVEGFDRVLGAGGIKSTAGQHERRDKQAITAHEANQQKLEGIVCIHGVILSGLVAIDMPLRYITSRFF
jgi:hypothetical protein